MRSISESQNATQPKTGSVLVLAIVAAGVLTGLAIGVGSFTFLYAKGGSYMTNDPQACANCHIMQDHFDAWRHSSHHHVAVCNDCHAPHDIIGKYFVKAVNGYNHSVAFTTGNFPDPLRITEFNRKVTEQSCRHCHESIVHQIDAIPEHRGALDCIRCHSTVGHLE